jgi:alcohol dehydrogenase (cytochrome c)
MGKELGAETWKRPKSAKTGGGGVWGAMTLDATTGELFVPVGNPWPDLDLDWRPGTNLFTNSMLVLDAHTGALKWWHQAVSADMHDLDLTAAPVLYRNSQIQDVLAFGGKDGYVVALDRDTHKVLFRTPVTRIENPGARASKEGTRVCPGFAGGIQWNGPTLDRLNNNLITGAVDWCMTLVTAPTVYAPPKVAYGGFPKPDPQGSGVVTALDAETGAIRWRYEAEKPVVAGVTPTAGGVTFAGDLAGNFLVLDSKTGGLIKKTPTGGALAGGVVTYEIGGRQYVAVSSGNVSRTAFGALGLPSVVILALNGNGMSMPAPSLSDAPAGVPNPGRGHDLFVQICASCHGSDGDTIGDHKLSTLASRRDRASTVAYIKHPKPPMPALFPSALTEQNVIDVSAYLQQGIGR